MSTFPAFTERPDPRTAAGEEDPYELVGVVFDATHDDLVEMARCIIEEYLLLGYPVQRVLRFFESPVYSASHHLLQQLGHDTIRALVAEATEG